MYVELSLELRTKLAGVVLYFQKTKKKTHKDHLFI